MFRKIFTTVFATVAMLGASPALADPITLGAGDEGTTFSLDFDGSSDGSDIAGLTSSITFTLVSIDPDGTYNFTYDVDNTSSGGTTGTVTGFAFNVDPDITDATSTGTFDNSTLNKNYPNGIGTVDVCFKAKKSGSCAGSGSGSDGVATNDPNGTGTLSLFFADPTSPITLSDFYVRYQAVNGDGSATGAVTTTSGGTPPSTTGGTPPSTTGGTPVPEPGMLGLFGIGLVGLGLMRRRRKIAA